MQTRKTPCIAEDQWHPRRLNSEPSDPYSEPGVVGVVKPLPAWPTWSKSKEAPRFGGGQAERNRTVSNSPDLGLHRL